LLKDLAVVALKTLAVVTLVAVFAKRRPVAAVAALGAAGLTDFVVAGLVADLELVSDFLFTAMCVSSLRQLNLNSAYAVR